MSRSKNPRLRTPLESQVIAVTQQGRRLISPLLSDDSNLPAPLPALLADESSLPAWPLLSRPMKQYLLFRAHSLSQQQALDRLAEALHVSQAAAKTALEGWRTSSPLYDQAVRQVHRDPTDFELILEKRLFLDELLPTLETLCIIRDTGSSRDRLTASQAILTWITDHYRTRFLAKMMTLDPESTAISSFAFQRISAPDGSTAERGSVQIGGD